MRLPGDHFALTAEEMGAIEAGPDDAARLAMLTDTIEPHDFDTCRAFVAEGDQAGDATHRAPTVGALTWTGWT
mgnify:CR=1 FL=1